ncbi:sulfonate/nitrate/taurine transport system substrate-binding protein [Proteiniborus sp. DW1]|uniref:ABC transporter substrate-binding protein n=1 Tax=Proteiniborus sp. DW1 TaxID=1889883 RepID=UPI00092E0268|nr:ABC transporter substrate-binding protein [Proteiniborus sp. DW1]SCG84323.1 sulfonate/nitrate/taurine transport system substrate-binding protein [Proteiniborus sp. DW1]
MKNKISLLLIFVLLLGVLAGCSSNTGQEPKKDVQVGDTTGGATEELSEEELWKKEPMYGKTIKVGYSGGLCEGSSGIAEALGFYEKEGLDVEIVNVQQFIDAVGTNQIQMTSSHIAQLLVPAVNGVNMIFTTGIQSGCKSLYVLNNDEINNTSDLIGKTVAIPAGIGSSDHNIALRFFNHDNINPNEVNFKQVESSASILSMQNGEVQGVVLSDQFAEQFVNDGTLKIIRSLTYDEDFKTEPCCVYALNRDFVKENPITAKKLTKAVQEARFWISDNLEEATQILFDNNWASGDFDKAVRMISSYDWTISDENTEIALTNIIDDYKTFGLIDSSLDTQETLNHVWNPLMKR